MTSTIQLHQSRRDLDRIDFMQGVFSGPTDPRLEQFIQRMIDANRTNLPDELSQKLFRELFLYGFLTAHQHEFVSNRGEARYESRYTEREWEYGARVFGTNNGVLAVADDQRRLHIRGGESYHGYMDGDGTPAGIEGTLIQSRYKPQTPRVAHSNGEQFSDERRERLFQALRSFSREVRGLRGEATSGCIVSDGLSLPKTPYQARNPALPEIIVEGAIFIPGNKENSMVVYR
ncbi:hypothetical protein HYS47_00845 [Candidatus Woesearchaeota archaeon]|nr:hypothetical protein [Candidatus Woesearchaeota archaeon]